MRMIRPRQNGKSRASQACLSLKHLIRPFEEKEVAEKDVAGVQMEARDDFPADYKENLLVVSDRIPTAGTVRQAAGQLRAGVRGGWLTHSPPLKNRSKTLPD